MYKKLLASLFAFLCIGLLSNVYAQVQIGATSYTSLKAAFDAINAGTHTGAITIQITGNSTETATAVLNKSGTGSASYTSVTLYPTGTYTISANTTDGVIELRNAANITIDGRINQTGTTNGLTLQSTNTSGSPVIWMDSTITSGTGPKDITIRNCNIIGGTNTSSSAFGIVASSSSSKTTGLYGLSNIKILNNLFKNHYYGVRLYGVSSSRTQSCEIDGNTFGGDDPLDGINYYVIYVYYHQNTKINNNIIKNVYTTANSIYCIYNYYGETCQITNNTVRDISVGYSCYGSYHVSSNNTLIRNNKFYNLRSNSTSGYGVYGIYISSGNSDTLVNNVIYNLTSTNYSSTSTLNPYAIYIAGGTGHVLYHNSVHLYGTQSGSNTSATRSACLYVSSSSATGMIIRNNVFANGLVGLSGSSSYCVYFSANPSTITMNNNCYYAYGTYGKLGYYTSDRLTLGDWQTATSQDANSIASNPIFNANNVLVPFTGSPLQNAGAAIAAFNVDILGVTRSATTPTIGAYEQVGDIAGPAITFTPINNTTSLTNRVLTDFANITDLSGVNNSTNPPRLYYKKQSNANTYVDNTSATNGWKYVVGTQNGNNWSFTINNSLINGGVATADVIEYFVVAQDNFTTANVGSTATLNTSPSSVALIAANFPVTGSSKYTLATPYSGTIEVGTGKTITSLTGANGLFNALNNGALVGNLNVNITSDLTEDGTVALNQIVEESGSGFTVTIRPATATNYTISGNYAGGLIRLNGADRIVFDGRFSGNGTYLTFQNLSTASSAVFQITSLGANAGATFNTIRNCNISTNSIAAATYGIVANGSLTSFTTTGMDIDNLSIIANNIKKTKNAIYIYGASGSVDNLIIDRNVIGSDVVSESISHKGIDIQDCNAPQITNNTIKNVIWESTTSDYYQAGIELKSGTINNPIITGNTITSVKNPNTGGWGAYGINIEATVSGGTLANNFVSDITTLNYSSSSTLYNAFGIRLTTAVTNLNVHHNTVNMASATPDVGTSVGMCAAFLVTATSSSGLSVRNNIFINKNTFTVSGSKSYAIYLPSGFTFGSIANNDYYVSGTNGVLAYVGADKTTLADFKASITNDLTSITKDVTFLNSTSGVLQNPSCYDTELNAPVLATVSTDMHGETRTTNNNKIGIDVVQPSNITATSLPANVAKCAGFTQVWSFTPSIAGFVDGIARTGTNGDNSLYNYTWYYNGNPVDEESGEFTVNRNELTLLSSQEWNAGNYYCQFTFMGNTYSTNVSTLGMEVPVAIDNPKNTYTGCLHDPNVVMSVSASGTIIGYKWFKETSPNVWTEILGETTNTYVKPMGTYNDMVGTYKVQVLGPGNCGPAFEEATFKISMDIPLESATFKAEDAEGNELDYMLLCEESYIKFSVVPGPGTITGYQWQVKRNNVWIDLPVVEYPSAITPTLIIEKSRPDQSGEYRCIIKGSPACNLDLYAETQIKVWPRFKFAYEPESQTICENENIKLGVVGDGEILAYQWLKDGEPIDAAKNPTAITPFLEISKADYLMSGSYVAQLTIKDCRGIMNVYTAPAQVYVMRATQITKQPAAITLVELGSKVELVVEAHHKGKTPPFYKDKFQWYRYNASTQTSTTLVDNAKFAGATSSVLSINHVEASDITENGDYYYVVVEGICGNATSSPALINEAAKLTIKTQPQGATVCESNPVKLTFEAEANSSKYTIEYSWYKDGALIPNANTNELTINAMAADAGKYKAIAKIANMPNVNVESQEVELIVNVGPTITTQPLAKIDLTAGKDLELTVVAAGSGTLTYEWYKDGAVIANANADSFKKTNVDVNDAGTYTVKITNDCGEITSDASVVTVTKTGIVSVYDVNGYNRLLPVAPNPISNNAVIAFESTSDAHARLAISDINGKELLVLFDNNANSGINRINFNPSELMLANGSYIITLNLAGQTYYTNIVIAR